MDITKEELIELIDEDFNECINEGESKFSAIESFIHNYARLLIRNKTNQLIAHERFKELLQGEEESDYYKEIVRVIDYLKKQL